MNAWRRHRRLAGSILGLLLFAAALWAILGSGDQLARASRHLAGQPAWRLALVLLLPLANWSLVSLSFWVLMRRAGPLDAGEMHALVGTSWLLNYLPLRPGMIGRLTYHSTVNAIPLRHSLRVMIVLMGFTLVAGAIMGSVTLASARSPFWLWSILLASPALAMLGVALATTGRGSAHAWALLIRYLDMGAWALRYWILFTIVGSPISAPAAIAVALVSQAASLVPISGNGLGIREWSVGLLAGMLPASIPGEGVGAGLAADLLNRAAELAVSIPLGLLCAQRVSARLSRERPPVAARSDR